LRKVDEDLLSPTQVSSKFEDRSQRSRSRLPSGRSPQPQTRKASNRLTQFIQEQNNERHGKLETIGYAIYLTNDQKQKSMQELLNIGTKEKSRTLKDTALGPTVNRHIISPLIQHNALAKEGIDQIQQQQLKPSRKSNQEEKFKKTNLTSSLIEAEILSSLLPEFPLVNFTQGQEDMTNLMVSLSGFLHIPNKAQTSARKCLEAILESQNANLTFGGLCQAVL